LPIPLVAVEKVIIFETAVLSEKIGKFGPGLVPIWVRGDYEPTSASVQRDVPGPALRQTLACPGEARTMQTYRRLWMLWATGVGLTVSALSGCQGTMAGMTLPSGRYLEHYPQYFPQEPDFPLPRELAYQEETAGLLNRPAAPGAGLVNPVPPGAVPAPPVPMPPPR